MATEGELKSLIRDWINAQPEGAVRILQLGGIAGRRSASKGISDLVGTWNGLGLFIEVKVPGGRVSKEQSEFIETMKRKHAIAFVAESLEQVIDQLKKRRGTMKSILFATIGLLATTSYASYPDPALTPGDTLPVTVKQICVPGYSATVRHVTQATKRKVLASYGLKKCNCEVDHLISLELGGSNAISNLWPQMYPEAREKDKLENRLHRAVCRGQTSLKDAQEQLRNWGRK